MVKLVTRTVFSDGLVEESCQNVRTEAAARSSVAWAAREYVKAGYENVTVTDTCASAIDPEDGATVSKFYTC